VSATPSVQDARESDAALLVGGGDDPVEGLDGFDRASQLAAPNRRRIRGVAAQSVFVAFLLLAVNLALIDKFEESMIIDPDGTKGTARRRAHRRKTTSLQAWDLTTRPPEAGGCVGNPLCARGDLNPHVLSDTGT
jgi:hypothetical protein